MSCFRYCRGGRWRIVFGPIAVVLYCLIVAVVIPLAAVEMAAREKQILSRRIGWFTAGLLVVFTLPISLWDIGFHLYHYTYPPLQRHIIRILWMVPVYSICSWIGLRADATRVYMESLISLYEAFVVYSFMHYLTSYLAMEYDIVAVLERRPQTYHMKPFCCLQVWLKGKQFWKLCRFGVYQYTALNLLVTIIALACEFAGKYEDGKFSGSNPWLYLCITTNLSQIWAMYCLILFYQATKKELEPISPFMKFLCIKAVVFFSFWQRVFLDVLQAAGALKAINPDKNLTCGADSNCGWNAHQIQELIICIEMFFAAIAHHFAFSYKPFVDQAASRPSLCKSFWLMFDVRDVHQETLEHAEDTKIRLMEYSKKIRGYTLPQNQGDTESVPLLEMSTGRGKEGGDLRHTSSHPVDINRSPTSQSGNDGRRSDGDGMSSLRDCFVRDSYREAPTVVSVKDAVQGRISVRQDGDIDDTTL